jgi:predicted DNA-binding transcriptional regulator AlpA
LGVLGRMKDMRKSLSERLGREYYTLKEVAEFLCMAKQTLYNRRGKGTAPKATKVGGRLLFDVKDVEEYLMREAKYEHH